MTDFDSAIIYCGGKEAYETKASALTSKKRRLGRAKSLRNCHKEKKRAVTPLQPYRCERCHAWHLGTRHNGTRQI